MPQVHLNKVSKAITKNFKILIGYDLGIQGHNNYDDLMHSNRRLCRVCIRGHIERRSMICDLINLRGRKTRVPSLGSIKLITTQDMCMLETRVPRLSSIKLITTQDMCMFVCVRIIRTYKCVLHKHACMYVCMCVCVYIYTHMYIMHIYTSFACRIGLLCQMHLSGYIAYARVYLTHAP
jgi:hypothetical protein